MDRQNSFTFLRHFFALAVVFSHSFALGGFGVDPLARVVGDNTQIGVVAVLCFFVISGWLITGSALRTPIWRFALNRVMRILPGFGVMHLLMVFALAPAVMLWSHAGLGYFESLFVGPNSAWAFLVQNAQLHVVQYSITDVFRQNPGGSAINGSLWSLAPEFICYVWLGLLAWVGGLRWRFTGLVLFTAVFVLHLIGLRDPSALYPLAGALQEVKTVAFHQPLFRSAYLAFLAGLALRQLGVNWRWRGWLASLAVVVTIVAATQKLFVFIWPLTLPYVVLYLAHRLPFHRLEGRGDCSYGIYIYSFPIQQLLALAGFQRFGFLAYFGASAVLSILAGMASWRWVEAPALRWARRLQTKPAPLPCPAVATPAA